jgi:phosphoglycerol transferase MdoB-like AlkP superfamily enzyme
LSESKPMTKKYKIFWCAYLAASLIFLILYREVFFTKQSPEPSWKGPLIFFALAGTLVFSVLFAMFRMRGRKKTDEKGHEIRGSLRPKHFILIAANCVFCFWMMEFVNNDDILSIKPLYVAMNLAGIFIMSMIWLFWLNSWRRSLIAMLSFYGTMTVIFYAVYQLRGEPFQFIDVFSIGTAMDVAGNYHLEMSRACVTVIVLVLSVMVIYLHLPDFQIAKRVLGKILMRVGIFVFMVGMYYFYLNVNWNGAAGIVTDLFAPEKTYQETGTSVGFFCVAKYMRLTPPEGYSVEETEKIAEEATEEETPNEDTAVKPVNIIVIMNESWADYRKIGDFTTNQEVMPFYDSMKENTIKGYTLVCIQGGGTAKTEYEFLTGNSVKRFPAMVPYVSYFTHDQYSLVTTLEAQGYETMAMHPYKRSNWNRETAYRLLNFDEYLSEESFGDDTERIRGFISDRGNYEKIIEEVNKKNEEGKSFFLFDVTMQNHGGYNTPGYQADVKVDGYSDTSVENFLSLERESDEALEYLITYFQDYDEPTLIVMFGDHYPSMPESFTKFLSGKTYDQSTLEEKENYYATPFFIWANYDIPEKENVMTSTNYLGTLMLEETGLEMAPYNYYLEDLMKSMPALNHLGYMDAEGTFHSWASGEKEALEQEWEYECLQYNNLAEKRKRLDWFFTVSSEDADVKNRSG